MLHAAELHSRAAQYRSAAKREKDARTREQYLAVAEYLDEWANHAEVIAEAEPGLQAYSAGTGD